MSARYSINMVIEWSSKDVVDIRVVAPNMQTMASYRSWCGDDEVGNERLGKLVEQATEVMIATYKDLP